jgi:hypothetical protein
MKGKRRKMKSEKWKSDERKSNRFDGFSRFIPISGRYNHAPGPPYRPENGITLLDPL